MPGEREQAIRERAYAIWEEEGRQNGKALDHWLRAMSDDANCRCRMTARLKALRRGGTWPSKKYNLLPSKNTGSRLMN
jgi:hypothetical protein